MKLTEKAVNNVKPRVKHKHKSMRVRWKIFGWMLSVTAFLIVMLWLVQTVFLDVFYRHVKTSELKKATISVVDNIENSDIQDRILFLSKSGQISIRVIDTNAFQNVYTSGENNNSVMYGMGAYELLDIYESAVRNGGEVTQYYSDTDHAQPTVFSGAITIQEAPETSQQSNVDNTVGRYTAESDVVPVVQDGNTSESISADSAAEEPGNGEKDVTHEFRFYRAFEKAPRPSFFTAGDEHNELLYAKITKLTSGAEIMVVADTRITPLDSTVETLRYQLFAGSVATILVSLIISLVVAKRISKPIEKINDSARVLAGGKFDTRFEGKGYREIEELSDTLNYASSELGKVEAFRRDLLANVSHDMRTPLTMIVGYSEVMRDIPGENTPENVQVIIDEARRLTEFVNNVLDLSKLQSGIEKLEMEVTCLTDDLEKLTSRYKMLYVNSGYKVVLDAPDKVWVRCDVTKMSQVILNLIDNGVNYTGEDKTVTVRQKLTDDGFVRIEVSDTGEGISPEQLPYIWDRYYKNDKSHRRNVVGSGIGLSIVKAILTLHKAKFGVESEMGNGSTFWFEIETVKKPGRFDV